MHDHQASQRERGGPWWRRRRRRRLGGQQRRWRSLARLRKLLSVMPMRLRNGHQELAWQRGARAQHQEGARQGSQQHIRRGAASGTARLGHLRCHSVKRGRGYRPGAGLHILNPDPRCTVRSCSDPHPRDAALPAGSTPLAPLRAEGGSCTDHSGALFCSLGCLFSLSSTAEPQSWNQCQCVIRTELGNVFVVK